MVSRFNAFDDSEKEVLRMALRRFFDDYLKAEMLGYGPSDLTVTAAALSFELLNGL